MSWEHHEHEQSPRTIAASSKIDHTLQGIASYFSDDGVEPILSSRSPSRLSMGASFGLLGSVGRLPSWRARHLWPLVSFQLHEGSKGDAMEEKSAVSKQRSPSRALRRKSSASVEVFSFGPPTRARGYEEALPSRHGNVKSLWLSAFFSLLVSSLACGGEWCPPESRCGHRCVDLQTDSEHCGACYVRCVHPAQCVEGICEAPCPPTYHDGGDGECLPRGRCSDGYHNGGDGVCVPEDECRPGYRDGGDGTCYPFGACAPGHHNGGDGSCTPIGTCAEGYELTPTGHCVVPR